MDTQPQDQIEEKIKLGTDEYTQEELQRLVGLGKIGVEAEEKYGVTLDKVWPNHQRTINEKFELQRKVDELERAKIQQPVQPPQNFDEAQMAQQARDQLNKLGYIPKAEVEQIIVNTIEGFRLRDGAQHVVESMSEQGYPKTTVDDLLNHMVQTGYRIPEKAYKDMFEAQIDAVKERKLASLKSGAMPTQQSSTAGAKVPAPQKITNENLQQALQAALRGIQQ